MPSQGGFGYNSSVTGDVFPVMSRQEMQRMAESTRLALRSLGRGTPAQSRGEREEQGMDSVHGRKLMEYVAMISEAGSMGEQ